MIAMSRLSRSDQSEGLYGSLGIDPTITDFYEFRLSIQLVDYRHGEKITKIPVGLTVGGTFYESYRCG